jgi:hypothetical protein
MVRTSIVVEEYATRIIGQKKRLQNTERNYNDLVFAVYQDREKRDPVMIYYNLARSFGKTLDRMGRDTREDGNERRRHITLHSLEDL